MNRRLAAVAASMALAVPAGCGIPTEDLPREVEPPGALAPGTVSPAPIATATGAVSTEICLVRDDELVRVVRGAATEPTVEAQLRQLIAGPSEQERDAGLTSALTGTNLVVGVRSRGDAVTVEIADTVAGATRSDEVFAFGQLVCALTAAPGVNRVYFVQHGRPIGVPRADGSLSPGPLTIADYASLLAGPR